MSESTERRWYLDASSQNDALRVFPDHWTFQNEEVFETEVTESMCEMDRDQRLTESEAIAWIHEHCPAGVEKLNEIVEWDTRWRMECPSVEELREGAEAWVTNRTGQIDSLIGVSVRAYWNATNDAVHIVAWMPREDDNDPPPYIPNTPAPNWPASPAPEPFEAKGPRAGGVVRGVQTTLLPNGDEVNEPVELPSELPTSEEPVKCKRCFAFVEAGEIDLDSISESQDDVRKKVLSACMGWRFEHPDTYDQGEQWQRLLESGSVVELSIGGDNSSYCDLLDLCSKLQERALAAEKRCEELEAEKLRDGDVQWRITSSKRKCWVPPLTTRPQVPFPVRHWDGEDATV